MPHPLGSDPDGDCGSAGRCDGAGACAGGNHIWSLRFGDALDQQAPALAVDGQGNLIVAGLHVGSVDFGGGLLQNSDAATFDVFVAKFDSDGQHVWSKRFGDAEQQTVASVAAGPNSGIAIAGRFQGQMDFGGGQLHQASSPGSVYLARFASDGTPNWSRAFTGFTPLDEPRVAIDPATDDLIVAGHFRGTVDFGLGNVTSTGSEDVFLAAFDASGATRWHALIASDGTDHDPGHPKVIGLHVGSDGGAVLGGNFDYPLHVGAETLEPVGQADIYVAKFDASGSAAWARHFAAADVPVAAQLISCLALTQADEPVLCGLYTAALSFGGDLLPLSAPGNLDVALAKLTPAGDHAWSYGYAGGPISPDEATYLTGAAVDEQDNVIAAGVLAHPVDFGSGPLLSAGGMDALLVKLSGAGQHIYSKRFGDAGHQVVSGVGVDPDGNVILAGLFQGQIDFGGPQPLTSAGNGDLFLVKLEP